MRRSKKKVEILGTEFFSRDSEVVAKELLGKFIVRKGDGIDAIETALMINEVEVYDGPDDMASHARFGEKGRAKIMFGSPGYIYVYLIYGMYYMINVVTREHGYPAAILIRGAGEFNGPGKLAKYLRIDKSLNEKPATPESGLWFEDRGIKIANSKIKKSPRIGVDYAAPIWHKKHYRFFV